MRCLAQLALVQAPQVAMPALLKPRPCLASEYHSCDFDWEDLRRDVEHLVNRQQELGHAAAAARALPPPQVPAPAAQQPLETQCGDTTFISPQATAASPPGYQHHHHQQQPAMTCGNGTRQQPKHDAVLLGTGVAQQQELMQPSTTAGVQGAGVAYDGNKWEEFYSSTARSAKFYKERRYLLLEFPVLATQEPQHVVELGCGYGPSLLPILRHNPNARVTGTDIAPTCVAQLRHVAEREAIDGHAERISTFVCDSSDPAARPLFDGLMGDVALIMFTLSAVTPERQALMLLNAWAALRPGGLLCIRDHGLYDMVQLRIPPEQWLGPNTYLRGDGTLAYFFSTQDLEQKATAAGFEIQQCEYATVYNRNRKTGQNLRRVFVHGVFRKPT